MKITINKPIEVNVSKLLVDATIRYTNAAEINTGDGWTEDNKEPKMPFMFKPVTAVNETSYHWMPIIDIDNGKISNWPLGVEAKLYYKVVDEFSCKLLDDNSDIIISYNGYVPPCMAIDDEGYGDYIYITIDNNGYIKDWNFSELDIDYMQN